MRGVSDAEILSVPAGVVAALMPDAVIVDMARPDRDALDDLRRVSADNPRPTVMFADRDDRAFMEEAIADVVDTAFPGIKPIVMAGSPFFGNTSSWPTNLTTARASLRERAIINRAMSTSRRPIAGCAGGDERKQTLGPT